MSERRVLTTHVGSLPRPPALLELLVRQDRGDEIDIAELRDATAHAVDDIVAQQVQCGIDVVSDGELSKISYTNYVKFRLGGIGQGEPLRHVPADLLDHPEFAQTGNASRTAAGTRPLSPTVVGPLTYEHREPLEADLAAFAAAVEHHRPTGAFLNAASPGVLPIFVYDEHYRDDDAYLAAVAEAMTVEYEAVVEAGFQLQLDAPDLAMGRHISNQDLTEDEFLRLVGRNVEVLNAATAGIAPDRMRMHICWGNYPGPHTHDIELSKIAHLVMAARPQTLLIEGGNPRHEHEFEDLRHIDIPDDKIICPGVIDTTTNVVEHPRVVEQRIVRWADVVGRDRIMAGTDCGFSSVATLPRVFPSVVWKKLGSLVAGAASASGKLFRE